VYKRAVYGFVSIALGCQPPSRELLFLCRLAVTTAAVNEGITGFISNLSTGVKRVVEEDHVIVLNWNSRGPSLVAELCEGTLRFPLSSRRPTFRMSGPLGIASRLVPFVES
jgi:hypothetical protein